MPLRGASDGRTILARLPTSSRAIIGRFCPESEHHVRQTACQPPARTRYRSHSSASSARASSVEGMTRPSSWRPCDLPVALICRRRRACAVGQIGGFPSCVSRPIKRGVSRSSRTLDAGCDGREPVQETNAPARGRRSCGVLMPRRWHQPGDDTCVSHRGWWQESPIARETAKETVKPSRGECRMSFGVPVVTNSCAFFTAREAAGASSVRHSLRPLPSAHLSGKARARSAPRECRPVSSRRCFCGSGLLRYRSQ